MSGVKPIKAGIDVYTTLNILHLESLKDGKIYSKLKIKKALENFFNRNNLIALWEIVLRRCADRINLYTDEKNKPFIKEHVLVSYMISFMQNRLK